MWIEAQEVDQRTIDHAAVCYTNDRLPFVFSGDPSERGGDAQHKPSPALPTRIDLFERLFVEIDPPEALFVAIEGETVALRSDPKLLEIVVGNYG